MTRQPLPAFGLPALALAFVPMLFASADEPAAKVEHAPAASAKHEAGGHPAPASAPAAHVSDAPGEHGSSQPNILEPQAPLAIWTVVVFGTLLLILGKFAWKPLMKALHDREEHIEHCLLESEKARNEAERLMVENQKNLAHAADHVRALIEEGKRAAEATAASIVQKAQAEAESARERAEREIASARDQALTEIWSKTADLAVSIAGKVLARDLNDADQRRLVEVAMSELPAMTNGEGRRS